MKAPRHNIFCLDRLSLLLLQIWVLGRGWRGLSSLERNECGSCSGFRVPGNCVIVGCPFYRRLLLIGLLCLSLSALSKNDTGPDQEQERWYFWCWARWGSAGDRTCSLLLTCSLVLPSKLWNLHSGKKFVRVSIHTRCRAEGCRAGCGAWSCTGWG